MANIQSEESFAKFFLAQFQQVNAQVSAALVTAPTNQGLVDHSALHQKLSGGVSSWTVNISVKFLKRPQGYDGPVQLTHEVDLNNTRVSDLKAWIEQEIKLPVKSQRLVYKGKAMSDGTLLKEYYDASASGGWTVHCMASGPIVSNSTAADPRPASTSSSIATTAAAAVEDGKLPPVFWKGMEEYLKTHLPADKVPRILETFKRSLAEKQQVE